MRGPVGTCCVVLHTHLPWLAHHGSWPVGEEWLYQAWAGAYLPVVGLLERLAAEGRSRLLTLGVTPVLAAQLDDAYCLDELHTWLGFWRVRAESLAHRAGEPGTDPRLAAVAAEEFRAAGAALDAYDRGWRHGASPMLRRLADADAVELLGGPATHPFQPLLHDRLVRFGLQVGLDDARLRTGRRPAGVWAPECGYRPGLEDAYAATGVRHFLVDGPTLRSSGYDTADAWTVGDSGVVAFGRDLEVTYRVWSPRRGYPGGPWYRDFHTWDPPTGLRSARVTSTRTPPAAKAPYERERALAAADRDARDFVGVVRQRLLDAAAARDGRPGLVVVAYDTELFGHWWHEGPRFLEQVLRLLPEAGVQVTTLAGAVEAGHVAGPARLRAGSWGSGKDWRVWDGAAVGDLVEQGATVQRRLLAAADHARPGPAADPALDQLAREALLALASDWAFMVTKDSAAGYARQRAADHVAAFAALADALRRGAPTGGLVARLRRVDRPLGHLDARQLARR